LLSSLPIPGFRSQIGFGLGLGWSTEPPPLSPRFQSRPGNAILTSMRLWPIMLLAVAADAQTPNRAAIYRVGNGVSAPVPINQNQPEYSAEARVARLEGAVALSLVVGADGHPSDIRVRKSVGMGLDENAVLAVSAWRFKPAMKGDQPVAVESTIEVSFHLYANSDWHLNRAAFQTEPGVSMPTVIRAPYPEMTQGPGYATFRLEVQIDERGVPREVKILSSSEPTLDDEVIRLIREWRFHAAEKAGQPVAVTAEFDFSHGEAPVPAAPAPGLRRKP
jgi:TonB family protein